MKLTAISPTEIDLDVAPEILADQGIKLLDAAPILAHVGARFAFPDDLFDDFLFLRPSNKLIRIASRPLAIPRRPGIDRAGLDFLHTDMANPRMTTSAAMTWAQNARTNVVDTDRAQCEDYLRRAPLILNDAQLERCTGRGFVLIRHFGYGLGVGFLESTRPDDENIGHVRSLYPSAYAVDLEQSSPFGNPS